MATPWTEQDYQEALDERIGIVQFEGNLPESVAIADGLKWLEDFRNAKKRL